MTSANPWAPLFPTVTELEAPIMELENRARIMFRITGDMDEGDGMAVYQLACDVKTATSRLSEIHRQLFRITHPNPDRVVEAQKLAENTAHEAVAPVDAESPRTGVGPPRRAADAELSHTIPAMPNRVGKSG